MTAATSNPAPGLCCHHEAPDQVRGGVHMSMATEHRGTRARVQPFKLEGLA